MKRNQKNTRILIICVAAMFTALICACCFISIPLPFGYFNLGDVAILLAAFILGYPAAISAALGASLADILMGYTIYAPATAVIKALCVVSVCVILHLTQNLPDKKSILLARMLGASVTAEILMISGYLLFEAFILSYGGAALASVPGNCMQGICAVIGSIPIYSALKMSNAIKYIRNTPTKKIK